MVHVGAEALREKGLHCKLINLKLSLIFFFFINFSKLYITFFRDFTCDPLLLFLSAPCGDILPHTNKNQTFVGSLMSTPRGQNKCVWIISVPRGKIELVFKDKFLVTSHGKDCRDDFVQVQDGKFR